MRLLQYLQETYEFHITGNRKKGYVGSSDVFSNPTVKELISLKDNVKYIDGIRYIINFKTKNLYVWRWDVVHFEGADGLYINNFIPTNNLNKLKFWNTCCAAEGDIIGNKIEYTRLSDYGYRFSSKDFLWLNNDDAWLNTWFTKPFNKTLIIKEHLNLEDKE